MHRNTHAGPSASRPTTTRSLLLITLVGVLGLAITWIAFREALDHHEQQAAARFRTEVDTRVAALSRGVAQAAERLRSVAAFYLSSEAVSAQEFRDFTAAYLHHEAGLAAMGWAPARFDSVVDDTEASASGPTHGASMPLEHLEPGPSGGLDFDADLSDDPQVLAAIDEAFRSGYVQFVRRDDVLLLLTPTLDRVDWSGVAVAVLPVASIRSWIGLSEWPVALEIVDRATGEPVLAHGGLGDVAYETSFDVDGGSWLVRAAPQHSDGLPLGPLGGLAAGVVITGLLVFLMLTLAGSAARANELVRQRTRELEQAEAEARAQAVRLADEVSHNHQLIASIPSLMVGVDAQGRVTGWNRSIARLSGIAAADAIGRPLRECGWNGDLAQLCADVDTCLSSGQPQRSNGLRFRNAAGGESIVGMTYTPFVNSEGQLAGCLVFGADVTERNAMELQLRESQRLEAVGRLAAGIAHEVNTPAQFVSDNTSFLRDAFEDLLQLESEYSRLFDELGDALAPAQREALNEAREAADREYLLEEVPQALEQSMDGIRRIADIVRAMKEFSHPGGGGEKEQVDLNRLIRNAITVAANEWKYHATVETELDETLPPVPCYPRELNQVVLNLLINAAHAIADRMGDSGERGVIRIVTARGDGHVLMQVSDTGTGIPEEVRDKIFEPFFTTKEVGRGSGQGLALAYSAVVEQHQGELKFDTEIGAGTTFHVHLPLEPQEAAA